MNQQHASPAVFAIVFNDARKARAARRAVRKLMRSHALCVEATAIAKRRADGGITVTIPRILPWAGLAGGLAWGAVLGGMAAQPVIGVLAGGLSGAIVGALTPSGLDRDWVREASKDLGPGEAALVMAAPHAQQTDSLDRVAGDSGRVIEHADHQPWGREKGTGHAGS